MIQQVTRKGKQYMLVPKDEYERLVAQRGGDVEANLPALPAKLPNGDYPALEYVAASLARDIIRTRRCVGLSQAELARRAGIRVETLNRIERMKGPPTVRTVEKIDRALKMAEVALTPSRRKAGRPQQAR
jgi:ribosome-binding protein aMBF1 (putative translation factor)